MRILLPPYENVQVDGLIDFKQYLSRRIIGQGRAMHSLVRGFNLVLADLLPPLRPIARLFFCGPTGVAKTETALAVADYLYEREAKVGIVYPERPLVQVDSAMYGVSLHFAITALVGSAPGYVGSRDKDKDGKDRGVKPILARDRFPEDRITVLLFDEIEKALSARDLGDNNNELQGILTTLLDKGQILTNWDLASGEERPQPTDFSRTVIIFTSNLGAREIEERAGRRPVNEILSPPNIIDTILARSDNISRGKSKHLDEATIRHLNDNIYELLNRTYKQTLPPELRNRMDGFVAFHFLTRENFYQILKEKELPILQRQFAEKHGINLVLTEEALNWVVDFGVVREEGVRSLQRFVLRKIVDPMATYLNAGMIPKNSIVSIDVTPKAVEEKGDNADALFEII